jgi:integrase/recombinase XerD
MGRKAHKALATFTTAHGPVHIRKTFSNQQRSWILTLEGPHAGLRQLLPDWKPRAPSTRTQISPPTPTKKVSDILAFFQVQVSVFYERLAGKAVPLATSSAAKSGTYRTIDELLKIVDHEAETSLRIGSVITYRHQWAALLRVLPRDTPLTDLTRERLQGIIGELGKTYASTTVTNIRNALSKLLVRAVEDNVLVFNPLAKVRVPKPVAKQQTPLSKEQRNAVLREAQSRGYDFYLLFHLLLGCGLRRSEALALVSEDVDFERRLLNVRSSEHFLTKTGNARSVPIPAEAFSLLMKNWKQTGFILKPDQPYAGGRYRWDFSKGFQSIVTAAGVPWVTPHTCRHHYASWFLENGGSIFRLAAAMGHNLVETSQRYAHLVPGFGTEEGQDPNRAIPA